MSSEDSNQKTKLYFIRHPDHHLEPVEKFLRNREFETYSAIDFKEALTDIIRVQPHFVFVCLDHTNRKIMAVPKLLAQSFPVTVIPFIYSTAINSVRLLQNSPHEYKLFPPNTGPSIQRLINKIKKNELTGQKEKKDSKGHIISENQTPGANDAQVIRIGGANKGKGDWNIKADDISKSLESMIEGSGTNSTFMTADELLGESDELAGIAPQEHSQNSHTPAYRPDHSQTGPNTSGTPPTSAYNPQNSKSGQQGGFQNPGAAYNPSGAQGLGNVTRSNSSGTNSQPGYQPGSQSQNGSGGYQPSSVGVNPQGHNPTGVNTPKPGEGFGPAEHKSGNQVPGVKGPPVNPEVNSEDKIKTIPTVFGKSREKSNLEEGLENSMIQVSGGKITESGFERVTRVSNAACLAIESQKFTGYLVAAFGSQKKIDPAFVTLMKQRLTQFLQNQGEKVNSGDKMDVKIREVEFESWAVAQAEFLKKSVHNGNEVAMAFFPTPQANPKLQQSKNKEMLQVSIDDIHEDKAVEFDLYIYLPSNQKYILYTHNGEFLGGEQKGRLKSRGVSHLHFRKEEADKFRKYHAEKYLDGKIHEFEQKTKDAEDAKKKKAS